MILSFNIQVLCGYLLQRNVEKFRFFEKTIPVVWKNGKNCVILTQQALSVYKQLIRFVVQHLFIVFFRRVVYELLPIVFSQQIKYSNCRLHTIHEIINYVSKDVKNTSIFILISDIQNV